jgi:lambda family phage portal protein
MGRVRKIWNRAKQAARQAWTRWPEAVDELIYTVAPATGARRKATRRAWQRAKRREDVFNAAWKGADNGPLDAHRWMISRLSPDSEAEQDLETLRERSQAAYRTNEIAHGAVEGRVIHEVGTGITPQARVHAEGDLDAETAKAVNERLEDITRRWSEAGCDRTGQHSLALVQRLIVRTLANLGEAFVLLADRQDRSGRRPIPLVLDVIDPLRVETPDEYADDANVRLGVRYSADGEVLGYYVSRAHPYDTRDVTEGWDYYPRFDEAGQPRMLHVFEPLAPGQTRGFPWLAAALTRLKDAGDVVEYTIVAMQVEACFAAFVKPGQAGVSPHELARGTSSGTDSAGNRLEEIRPGAVEYLGYGEEIEFASPQRPGDTFTPFLEFALHSISACLNYPYELLAGDFLKSTFSSGRLAMMAGRVGMAVRRQTLVEKALIPIWKRIVFEAAILTRQLEDLVPTVLYLQTPHVIERHVWQCLRGIIHINPDQEAKARKTDLETNCTTHSAIYSEEGADWEDAFRQREVERAALVRQEVTLAALRKTLEAEAGLQPGESRGGLQLAEAAPLIAVEPPDPEDPQDDGNSQGDADNA